MFLLLLVLNLVISVLVCLVIAKVFDKPLANILQRLISEEVYKAWNKYLVFAIYVVGISGGVRVWDLQKYITPKTEGGSVLQLTQDRWILELYWTIIGTLQSIAWMLLLFFVFALIAYVIVKGQETRRVGKTG